ncbi:group III truncated hemoglobin [Sphingomonas parva]|uniref:group III truncated hemoglobin n=1 Tax=Sphingomonas parva TaxID=2555898 RepID=UPI001CDCBBF4|nr:group III truncated hemoglobin [Sphingomonas parva]
MKRNEITEDGLRVLVETFYAKVRQDPAIGPVFNAAIDDWPEHLEKLQAFWSSVTLGTGRYKGRPMPAHIKHADSISAASFERWLALWAETSGELFEAGPAAALQDKAGRIAESLAMGMAFHRDPDAALGLTRRAARTAWRPAEAD